MSNNLVALDSARPEHWTIFIDADAEPFISCVYNERKQHWAGVIQVRTLAELSQQINRAGNLMKAARAGRAYT